MEAYNNIFEIKNRLNLTYKGVNLGFIDFLKYGNGKDVSVSTFPNLKTYINEEKNGVNHEYFLESYNVNDCNCFNVTYTFYIDYDLYDILSFDDKLISNLYEKIESMFYIFKKKKDIFNYTIELEKFL